MFAILLKKCTGYCLRTKTLTYTWRVPKKLASLLPIIMNSMQMLKHMTQFLNEKTAEEDNETVFGLSP